MSVRIVILMIVVTAMGLGEAQAASYECRYLNFHRGPAPRTLHAELVCSDAAAEPPCDVFRVWKVFRFAPGTTAAERRATMRQEARRFLRIQFRARSCSVTDQDADNAGVSLDDQSP